jgi:flagellin
VTLIRSKLDAPQLASIRRLEQTNRQIARALERLSSGQRINSARDDAAGLSIGTGLTSQINGNRQATRGLMDAQSYLFATDAALQSQIEIVQRLRELAVQASNGNLSATDRDNLSVEFVELQNELTRINQTASFNGQNLLDGSLENIKIQSSSQTGDQIQLNIEEQNLIITEENVTVEATRDFELTQSLAGHATNYFVDSGDLNDDGYDDLVTVAHSSGSSPGLQIRLGSASGLGEASYLAGFHGFQVELTDLNGDGHLDAMASMGTTIRVALGTGTGTFGAVTTYSNGGSGNGFRVADFNNDGNLDVLTSSGANYSVAFGDGEGAFTSTVAGAFHPDFSSTVVEGDLDGDGILDLVVMGTSLSSQASTHLGNGDGTFTFSHSFSINTGWAAMTLGDFNNDGNLDLLDPRSGVRLGDGNGNFAAAIAGVDLGAHYQMAIDLDGDGNLDLFKEADSGLRVYWGDGTGTLGNSEFLSVPGAVNVFRGGAGDFNGDGVTDLIALDLGTNLINVFTQDAIITVETETLTPSIQTQEEAQDSLDILDQMLQRLIDQRTQVGSQIVRFDSAIANNQTTVESLEAARSHLLDTDYAETTADLARLQILQQAGVAVIAQANLNLKMVLELL